MDRKIKIKALESCIFPSLLYDCQTWNLTEKQKKNLQICQRKMERKILGQVANQWGVSCINTEHSATHGTTMQNSSSHAYTLSCPSKEEALALQGTIGFSFHFSVYGYLPIHRTPFIIGVADLPTFWSWHLMTLSWIYFNFHFPLGYKCK